jgi:hypothetical protein
MYYKVFLFYNKNFWIVCYNQAMSKERGEQYMNPDEEIHAGSIMNRLSPRNDQFFISAVKVVDSMILEQDKNKIREFDRTMKQYRRDFGYTEDEARDEAGKDSPDEQTAHEEFVKSVERVRATLLSD